MRTTIKTIVPALMLAAMFTACGNANEETKQEEMTSESVVEEEKTDQFAGIQFASDKDTICGMPLTAGVADTLMVDEKIYGFCATECKEEFAKILAKQ